MATPSCHSIGGPNVKALRMPAGTPTQAPPDQRQFFAQWDRSQLKMVTSTTSSIVAMNSTCMITPSIEPRARRMPCLRQSERWSCYPPGAFVREAEFLFDCTLVDDNERGLARNINAVIGEYLF